MNWKVLILGLGNIGFRYDLDEPDFKVLTHARAFDRHPDFKLVGGVDPVPSNRKRFQRAYDVAAFGTIADALIKTEADVVVVATPTILHLENLREIVSFSKPRLVLMEKPAAYCLEQAVEMIQISKENALPILINLVRRTDPSVMEIRSRIEAQEIKLPCKGVVWYSKGLIHNACHFIDLLSFWLGQPRNLSLLEAGRKINDFDSEPDLRIEFSDSTIYFLAKNNEEFSYYNIELLAQNGRLNFGSGDVPISWQGRSEINPGLDTPQSEIENELHQYQLNVVNNIGRFLSNQASLLPSLEEHVETLKLVFEIAVQAGE